MRRLLEGIRILFSALLIFVGALVPSPSVAADGSGTIYGAVKVTGSEVGIVGPFYLFVVPVADAARVVPDEEFKAGASVTDDRGNFKKDGLAPGKYLVGVLLAPQALEGEYRESIRVQTSQSVDPIALPAVQVDLPDGGAVRVDFLKRPNPTPPPGLKPPASGGALGAGDPRGGEAGRSLTVAGSVLVVLGIAGAALGAASVRRARKRAS